VPFWLYWTVLPATSAFVLLFVLNGFANGWACAYDLMLAIVSPWDSAEVRYHWLAGLLSFGGWLLAPAFVGGVVGYAVNRAIAQHRVASVDEILERIAGRPFVPERDAGEGGDRT
jgi:Family of unknown function (DUF6313)